jgi:hypothetical protein
MDELYLFLMKNPNKFRKTDNIEINRDDNLFYELKKKFSDHDISKEDYKFILKKIEIYLNELVIKDVIENIINNIDESICIGHF